MSFAQALQIYAPLFGLVMLAFWTGGLSQRVKQLEKENITTELRERLMKLEVNMDNQTLKLGQLERSVAGAARQLGTLVSRGKGSTKVIEFGGEHGDV